MARHGVWWPGITVEMAYDPSGLPGGHAQVYPAPGNTPVRQHADDQQKQHLPEKIGPRCPLADNLRHAPA